MLIGEACLSSGSDSGAGTRVFLKPAENGKGPGFHRAMAVYGKISPYLEEEQRLVRIPKVLGIIPLLDGTEVLGYFNGMGRRTGACSYG